jgi:basic membrane protein A and related proteins
VKTISRTTALKGLALAAVASLALAGCAAAPAAPTATPVDYKACMVSDAGGFNDASFNQEAYAGLQQAVAELGVQSAKVESPEAATQTDYVSGIDSMIAEGCNLIVTVGFNLANATRDAAKANPKVNFALIDSPLSNDDFSPLSLPNVKPIQYDTAEAAYMAGYLAAATSKTGKVATYGGAPYPSVTIFMDGFKQGVEAYNKAKGKKIVVLGATGTDSSKWTFTGDFNDQAKGKTLTEGFFAQGADIVLPVAGPVGIGSGQATLDKKGTLVVGVDSDWYGIATHAAYKANILTSIEKKMAKAVLETIKSGVDGSFMGGNENQYVGNLSNGGVMISAQHDVAYPAGIQAELDALQADIISGKIVVTSIYKK